MLGRIKNYLGIEGVKVELVLPEEVRERDGVISGKLRFSSMNAQTVKRIRIALVEKYFRGRGKEKLVDEYEITFMFMDEVIEVPTDKVIEVPFDLPFELVRSDMEEWGKKNFIAGGFAQLAKLAYNVKSVFRVEAEAIVKGTALNPFDKKEIRIR